MYIDDDLSKWCEVSSDGNIIVTCPICNSKRTQKNVPTNAYCARCRAKHRVQNKTPTFKPRKCRFCGKEFTPNSSNQWYCKGPHVRRCPVCGKEYVEDNVENLKRDEVACSYECRVKRTRQTSLEKYGCVAPGNNPDARRKAESTMNLRYGGKTTLEAPKLKERAQTTLKSKYGVINPMQVKEISAKAIKTCIDRYGINHSNKISKLNREFAELLAQNDIRTSFEFQIENKLFDLKIDDQTTLIEINPTATHNSISNPWPPYNGLDKNYHLEKTRLANRHNYRVIHVFDWDNRDSIVDLLLPKTTIYARNCQVYKLNLDVTEEFLTQNHLQGSCRGQLVCLGLIHNNELVEVMTFGKPRYNKKYNAELLRLCSKKGLNVIGGASKLFKHFLTYYMAESIISYCDLSKFSGKVYEKIGMTFSHKTPPQEIWSRGDKKVTANLLRARGYDQIFNANYGKGTSNELLMLENGWLPVYDCGQGVYTYHRG